MQFRSYVEAIDAYPDASFDLVVVDGRARPSCLRQAIPKLRPRGLLVLDNSDRDYYLTLSRALLSGFAELTQRGLTPGLVQWSQSTVFTKP
jgi:predicted O-methyltransferase YrrM